MAEPLNAAFFTFKKRDRAVLLPATIVFALIVTAIIAAFVALNWNAFVGFRDMMLLAASGDQASEEDAFRFMGSFFALFGWALLFMFPLYIAIASYEAACLRWMIRGEAPGLFGLTIDNDVWRVWGIYWCWLIAQMVISMAMSMLMLPLMFMSMGEIMNDPTPEGMMRWQLTVQLPVTLLQYLPLIFFGIRFGPAAATSVLRNRFSMLEAWNVTRGRFWAIFGAYAIWAVVFGALFAASFLYSIYVQFDGDWGAYWRLLTHPVTEPEEIRALFEQAFSRESVVAIGVGAAFNLMLWLLWGLISFGINARVALAAQDEGRIAYVADEA